MASGSKRNPRGKEMKLLDIGDRASIAEYREGDMSRVSAVFVIMFK